MLATGAASESGAAQIEVDFLTGMIPHHRGAVAMSQMAVQKATHPELKEMAQTIIDIRIAKSDR